MNVSFQKYLKVNSDSGDKTLYGDIITHCKDWQNYADKSSKYTTAHECTHGINNDLRNASGDWQGKNGFYVGQDRAIILNEPKFKKSQIAEFIPQQLRGARYNLYVAGQMSWDDKPLYIYDEGVAYTNGAWAAIELKEQENYVEAVPKIYNKGLLAVQQSKKSDRWLPVPVQFEDEAGNTIVDGEVEFIAYMAAVLITADKNNCLQQNLIDFSRWLFRHASNAYYRSIKDGFPKFDEQDKLWMTMMVDSCYNTQRSFLASKIGYTFPTGEIPEDDPNPPPWFA